jgi:UDP-N-acetylmuramate--alanine ligase
VVPTAERAERGLVDRATRIHLVGIGGSGMSSLAALLRTWGKQVSGTDLSETAVARLSASGIRASVGHRAEALGAAELVIRSAAVLPSCKPPTSAACRSCRTPKRWAS